MAKKKTVKKKTVKTARKAPKRSKPVKATRRRTAAPVAQAPNQVMQMLTGFMVSKALSAAAKLGIPDALASGPRNYEALASAVGGEPDAIHRLMRALTSIGVFTEVKPGTFSLTPLSSSLRSDVPGSMRAMAVMLTTPSHWLPWGRLEDSLRKGVSVAEDVFKKPLWDYFKDNPDESAWFNGAMTSFSGLSAGAVVQAYDFRGFKKIVDVGGGHGFLLSTILRAAPKAAGVVYDLPQVINTVHKPDADVAGRLEFVAGDFFQNVPEGADCYTIKHIIHDWPEDRCQKILSNIQSVMATGGKVLILDAVLPTMTAPDPGYFMDMNMFAMTPGGRERTEKQFKDLCAASGLKLTRIIPTHSPVGVVEAVKA